MKFFRSQLVIFFLLAITANLWLLSKQDILTITQTPLRSLSQIFGLFGIVLMSLSLLLSTRIRFIEDLFGGLDKVYEKHQLIGGLSFMLILNHPLLLIIEALPFVQAALVYIIPGTNLAYTLGIASLAVMLMAFIFIVFIKLPYHIWKLTHQFMGLSFLLASVHAITVGSDMGNNIFLKIWILLFIALGIISVLYTIIFYKKFGPRYLYKVESLERKLDIINIILVPVKKPIRFDPGQFTFVSFKSRGIKDELHPFSISSAPGENFVRISAKILGDYTLTLPEVRTGDIAVLYGPYGKFGTPYLNSSTGEQVWIAGGIGVTPFLSMLRNEYLRHATGRNITFYYCYRSEEEGVFKEEIEGLRGKIPNSNIYFWCTNTAKRLTAQSVAEHITNIKNTSIQICGPLKMMEDLKKQFVTLGVPENNVYFKNLFIVYEIQYTNGSASPSVLSSGLRFRGPLRLEELEEVERLTIL